MNIRVTQKSMQKQYLNNMGKTLSQMNDMNNKILTKRKFLRASENPMGAARALVIRRGLCDLSSYDENLATAKGIFSSAETNLMTISKEITTVSERLISGVNGDKGQDGKETDEHTIIATEIRGIAENMLKELNSTYADRNLFGGTNNSEKAFTYDETTGKVSFNGVEVNSQSDPKKFPGTENPILVDIGLGIKESADGGIDPTTAMDISLNGAELTGCGVDSDGESKNILQLTYDAAKYLKDGNIEKARTLIDKIESARSTVLIGITNLGVKEASIENYQARNATETTSLQEAQVRVEGMTTEELAEAMTQYKMIEAAYNATLQMGANVIPTSLFDFIK